MIALSVWEEKKVLDSTVNKEVNRLKKRLAAANFTGLTLCIVGGGVKLIIDPPKSLPRLPANAKSDQQNVGLTV
jgi:hypothetical protein